MGEGGLHKVMRGVWATARRLAEFLEDVVREAEVGATVPARGQPLRFGGTVPAVSDESSERGRELHVDIRANDRHVAGRGRLYECIITVQIEGLCSLLVTASAADLRTAMLDASDRAVRAVETRMAIALWPAGESRA